MPTHRRLVAVVTGVVVLLGGGLCWAVINAQRLPSGPVAVAWDRDACGFCRMHVSERGFASQLQTRDGQVLHFDDPGCLMSYIKDNHPDIHATWFHHRSEDRWLDAEHVRFVKEDVTPMGYGLAAVGSEAGGATFAEMLNRVGEPGER